MTDQPYTKNPKLDRFITNMEHSIEDIKETLIEHTGVHAQILEQTTATNGKVGSIQKWREQMNGAIKVMVFIIPTVFGLMGWMAWEITHFDSKIKEALSVYETPNK